MVVRIVDAEKALEYARDEYRRFLEKQDPLLLADACEKAWMAAVIATDALLIHYGFKKPESYRERRELLDKLEETNEEAKHLGIADRFSARAYKLHILGFHERTLTPQEFEREMDKIQAYIKDVQNLIKKK